MAEERFQEKLLTLQVVAFASASKASKAVLFCFGFFLVESAPDIMALGQVVQTEISGLSMSRQTLNRTQLNRIS